MVRVLDARVDRRRRCHEVSETPSAVVRVSTRVLAREDAMRILDDVVRRRVAAAGHVYSGGTSSYWWEGALRTAEEWVVDFITTPGCADVVASLVAHAHPYRLPAVLIENMQCSAEYGAWVFSNVADQA